MNFFERQAQAHRHTRWLVLMFVLAVLATVAAVDFIVLSALYMIEIDTAALPDSGWMIQHPVALVVTSIIVLTVIGLASAYRTLSLAEGGGVVARSLNGVRVDRNSTDPLRRRLFNVVEEMAIASGVPMPEVYVLEHEGAINAFAAGHHTANAAVAVTRGALEKLNRNELQGVIAHEFSHVLNGDMRLNTRIMGLLFGLLVVALIGRLVLRHGAPRMRRGGAPIMLAALAVMVLGYVAVFMGRLLQAAVSRRRESLADACAVQFTREPEGLKGALVKIGAASGSRLHSVEAEEVAHMLFAPGMHRLFATHPPLEERIRTLDPRFNPKEFQRVRLAEAAEQRERDAASKRLETASALQLAPGAITQLIGNPGAMQIAAAQMLAQSMPSRTLESLSTPEGAQAALLALVLDAQTAVRDLQQQIIGEKLGPQIREQVARTEAAVGQLKSSQRLLLLDETLPELRKLPKAQRMRLLECLQRLVLTDGRIDLFEYVLATLARVYLMDDLNPAAAHRLKPEQASVELQILFSTLAQHGATNETEAQAAYAAGMQRVLPLSRLPYRPVKGWAPAMDRSLKCLDRLAPAGKQSLIEGLVLTVRHDQNLSVPESELLRAVCAALHCPLPPLLEVQ